MKEKTRVMVAFILLGIPIAMMLAVIFSQPQITAQVVNEVQEPRHTDVLMFWKMILGAVLVVSAFYFYEKTTGFQEKLQARLHVFYDIVPLLVRFGLAISFIVMVAMGFFSEMSLGAVYLAYLAVIIGVLLLFGLFTHFAAFLGLLLFLYSITQHGLGSMNDLSILGGLVYLLYLKRDHFSFDDIITHNKVDVDHNPPLTVLRVFQGLSLITVAYLLGYPPLFVVLGIFIILGLMIRLSEFVVIVIVVVNLLYQNMDVSIIMILLSAIALFISGYTVHSLDYALFHNKKLSQDIQSEQPYNESSSTKQHPTKKVSPKRKSKKNS